MTRWLAFERRWCGELCDAIVPVSANGPRTQPVDVEHACRRLLDAAPTRFRAATRLAVWVLMWSPLLVQHRLRTLTALDRDGRDAVLEQTLASPHALVRELAGVLRVVACICLVDGAEAVSTPETVVLR